MPYQNPNLNSIINKYLKINPNFVILATLKVIQNINKYNIIIALILILIAFYRKIEYKLTKNLNLKSLIVDQAD